MKRYKYFRITYMVDKSVVIETRYKIYNNYKRFVGLIDIWDRQGKAGMYKGDLNDKVKGYRYTISKSQHYDNRRTL